MVIWGKSFTNISGTRFVFEGDGLHMTENNAKVAQFSAKTAEKKQF